MWQPEQPGLPVSAQMKPLYIAREKTTGSKTYDDPIEVSPEKESWRIEAYNDFMNMNKNKNVKELPWNGKKYSSQGYTIILYPFEEVNIYPRFCISQNDEGYRHILSDDKEQLTTYLNNLDRKRAINKWRNGRSMGISHVSKGISSGGKRTKRTKRNKRTKRIHSMKRK